MNVKFEGTTVMKDYDVFARVGADKGEMRSFVVASDSDLNITLNAERGRPNVKGLEIVERLAVTEPELKPDPEPKPRPSECQGTSVPPSANLASVLATRPAGTTFCLASGTYPTSEVRLQSGDSLVGAGMDRTYIEGSGAHVLNADGTTNVTISDLDVSGATGTRECRPKCGRGIWASGNMLIERVHSHHNDNLGVGSGGTGLVIKDSEFSFNGSQEFSGCCAGGIKSGSSFTITGSHVHHNIGNGIWCDVSCPRFVVENNVVTQNTKNGIRFEHGGNVDLATVRKSTAFIAGNLVTGNNTSRTQPSGGIEINSASNVVVANNVLGNTASAPGIHIRGARFPLENIKIQDNSLRGDEIRSCTLSGVICLRNS